MGNFGSTRPTNSVNHHQQSNELMCPELGGTKSKEPFMSNALRQRAEYWEGGKGTNMN